MEARGREAGEHAAQQHNRRDALAPVRPHCNQQTHNRDDKRNVFVVQRRAMLDKQANNDADTYDDIIEVGVQPRYVAGVKRLNGFGRGRACGLRNCKAGERENEHRAHDDG